MKLLLDTHIWIWLLQSPERLGSCTQKELANESNELWVSPVSTWEALMLHRKRRVELNANFLAWLKQLTPGFIQAPFTHEIVLAAEHLDLHRDPADRFLAATAQVLDLTLVTADQRLLGLGTVRTMANR
ncbi:MAG TPA: type II toxin-antitoxin system VapC family toxin [Candidatus Methylomirabilis sp.]|nr:type II toxin-antitoxin system VapC family toxin [Candidatus Methylomirabilis sp.]